MKIANKDYPVGAVVPAEVVAKAAPQFYAAAEAQRTHPFSDETRKLDTFSMLSVMLADDEVPATGQIVADHNARYDSYMKRIKAAAKKGEILVYGDEYLANEALRGKYFVAKCNGLARKRHPEADEAIRIQDAQYSYNADTNTLYTPELR